MPQIVCANCKNGCKVFGPIDQVDHHEMTQCNKYSCDGKGCDAKGFTYTDWMTHMATCKYITRWRQNNMGIEQPICRFCNRCVIIADYEQHMLDHLQIVPCKNASSGCKFVDANHAHVTHQNSCMFRSVTCHVCWNDISFLLSQTHSCMCNLCLKTISFQKCTGHCGSNMCKSDRSDMIAENIPSYVNQFSQMIDISKL
jgi:hypothetical protein